MRILKRISRYDLCLKSNQYPWGLQKIKKFKKRKWTKKKLCSRFLIKKSQFALNFRFFRTYKQKIKKVLKNYFAAKLSDRQFKKLFRSNIRYKATLKRVLKSEYRLDTLVYRLFMLPSVAFARDLIKNNYFLVNGKNIDLSKLVLNVGDIIEPSNNLSWNFLYNNMLIVISSLKKYYSRLFFKFSFPFVIKRRRFRVKEFGKHKLKALKNITKAFSNRIVRRIFWLRYKKLRPGVISKINPARKYYYMPTKNNLREKRKKTHFLKKVKLKTSFNLLNFVSSSYAFNKYFQKSKLIKYKKIVNQLNAINLKLKKKEFKLKQKIYASKFNIQLKKVKKTKIRNAIKKKTNFRYLVLQKDKKYKLRRLKKNFKDLIITRCRSNFNKKNRKIFFFNKKIFKRRGKFFFNYRLKQINNNKFKSKNLKKKELYFINNNLGLPIFKKGLNFSFRKIIKQRFKLKKAVIKDNLNNNVNNYLIHKKKSNKLKKMKPISFLSKKSNAKFYKSLMIYNFFFKKRTRHFLVKKTFNTKNIKNFIIKLQSKKKKPRWQKWVPKQPKNYWQNNRINKKLTFIFRYLKKFNNNYKQFAYYQKLRQYNWIKLNSNFFLKKNFLYEKKRKQLYYTSSKIVKTTFDMYQQPNKGVPLIKSNFKTSFIYNNFKLNFINKEKSFFIKRIKRKYLKIKGFFRRYQDYKINITFNKNKNIIKPIQIRYKKIDLLFKNKPIPFYFAESNLKTLEFTLISDVDFLFFPYKSFIDFKMLSFLYSK
jgi:ribosomal protein S4